MQGRARREGGQLGHLGSNGETWGKQRSQALNRATAVGAQRTDARCTVMGEVTGLNWTIVERDQRWPLRSELGDTIYQNGKSGGRSRFSRAADEFHFTNILPPLLSCHQLVNLQ